MKRKSSMKLRAEWEAALPDLQLSVPFDLESSTAVVFRVGSHSHGTYVPPEDKFGVDDLDLMVVVIPPPEYVLGLKRFEHAQYKHGKLDVVFYDWGKWLRMIGKSNPNVVGTLYVELDDYYMPSGPTSPAMNVLWYRERLLSKRIYPAFVGYARAQLYKMTHFVHEGYMGDKRKRLVAEFGYDVKNAAHLIRLMRMACEAFDTGRLQVRRPDAEEIVAIKRGEWSKERVVEEAEELFARADRALAASAMREDPDELLLQRLMVKGYLDWWER